LTRDPAGRLSGGPDKDIDRNKGEEYAANSQGLCPRFLYPSRIKTES